MKRPISRPPRRRKTQDHCRAGREAGGDPGTGRLWFSAAAASIVMTPSPRVKTLGERHYTEMED